MTTVPHGSRARSIGWCLGLLATIALLDIVPIGRPAAPPGHDLLALWGWLDQASATDQAVALVRATAMGVATYLLVVSALMVIAARSGSGRVHRVLATMTTSSLRSALGPILGGALMVMPPSLGRMAHDADRLHPAFPGGGGGLRAELFYEAPPVDPIDLPPLELRFEPQPESSEQQMPDPSPPVERVLSEATLLVEPAELEPTSRNTGPSTAGETHASWTVACGEHFWSIAEAVLRSELGQPPSDDVLTDYWRALIEANRADLPDPGNPDLIHPGMELRLPAVSNHTPPVP